MPRRKIGWVPPLFHVKARGLGRVRLPGQGDVYFGPAGIWPADKPNPPKAVLDAYKRTLADWLEGGGADPAAAVLEGATVGELAAGYLDYVSRTFRKRGKPTRMLGQVRSMLRPVVKLFGDLPASQFGAAQSRAVRDELMKSSGRAKSTVQLYGARLKGMFSWAEREGIVPQPTMLAVRAVQWFDRQILIRETPGTKEPVPPDDIEATLLFLCRAAADMVRLQLVSGMRAEEVCYMRVGDLTAEDDGLLRYDARDDANKLAHKKIPKVVYFGERGQEILRPWLQSKDKSQSQSQSQEDKETRRKGDKERRNPDRSPCLPVSPSPCLLDEWVFPLPGRRPDAARGDAYRYLIEVACKKAGVPVWTPGRLRHSRLSETRKKYGLEGAQAEAGHTTSVMTGRYTHSAREELARKIARESG